MLSPITVAITGGAGQIGYSLLFSIARGAVFGPDQPIYLKILEIPPAMKVVEGVALELEDCAFGLLDGLDLSDDPESSLSDVNWALLVGSKPRGPGMERGDLIRENGPIFVSQGNALRKAAPDVRVLVIGNPCNTNCLIARRNAPEIPNDRWFAMTRLDHNRAVNQLAVKAGVDVNAVERVTIWGNHSATQYPDYHHALISGEPAISVIDDERWLQDEFISRVQKRGAEVIEARGKSSAASAASAICDHVRSFHHGTGENDWTSAAVVSDGSYGITEGLIASFPIQATSSGWEVVQGLEINEFSRARIDTSVKELEQERDVVADLL